MESCIRMPVDEVLLKELIEQGKDFAVTHGIVYRTKDEASSGDVVIHAPFQLFPSPIPRRCFQLACEVQGDYNILMHKVAHDHDFLKQCLENTIKVDDYTHRLWNIYETVQKEGVAQPLSLAMNRSDYMLHCSPDNPDLSPQLKQIEFNTMASSFGGLSQRVTQLHRYMLQIAGHTDRQSNCPENNCLDELADAMLLAWQLYNNNNAAILMLVLDVERNIYDQRILEHAIRAKDPKVKVIRRSLTDFENRGRLDDERRLIIDGQEVAVVYFRMCYIPDHFTSQKSWDTRLLIERSQAIKCPSMHYFLAGTKKVQQMLAQPGVVERFITDKMAADRIRSTFAGQYSLDMGDEGDRAVTMAMTDPDKFVLKPQREGGGNNLFGSAITETLSASQGSVERSAYVLMERILPATVVNYPVRSGESVVTASMVSELGIFGTVVGTKDTIHRNSHGGHILRTKTLGTDEGGVATGYSVLDSPYLV